MKWALKSYQSIKKHKQKRQRRETTWQAKRMTKIIASQWVEIESGVRKTKKNKQNQSMQKKYAYDDIAYKHL